MSAEIAVRIGEFATSVADHSHGSPDLNGRRLTLTNDQHRPSATLSAQRASMQQERTRKRLAPHGVAGRHGLTGAPGQRQMSAGRERCPQGPSLW